MLIILDVVEQNMEPLTGYPREVLPKLVRIVDSIAKDREVEEFYIGRTVDPHKRMTELASDSIFPIYSTDSADHAIEVEGGLIGQFYNHPKCSNDAPHGGGGVSEEYRDYVYVAIWLN
jgi:hypothetical protein